MNTFAYAQMQRNMASLHEVEGHYFRGDLVMSQKLIAYFDMTIQQEIAMFDDMDKDQYNALKLMAYYKTLEYAKDGDDVDGFMNNKWIKYTMKDVLP